MRRDEILQKQLPYDPLVPKPLPGIAPLERADWLRVDEAFAGQMRRREELIQGARSKVIAMSDGGRAAAEELLSLVIAAQLEKPGFAREGERISRPDGVSVAIDWSDPLATVGQLAQEDFCLLQKAEGEDEHVLTAAVLCFPASWSLDEKFMRPLVGIHIPVDSYDENIAKRVQRLFDGVRAERPLWRFNALWYQDPELHQPRRQDARREEREAQDLPYLRSELQTIRRLPATDAVVFGIHTHVLHRSDVIGGG
ncbi:DUF3445 domain-containing protein [Rhodobacteraceae bacterium D3-12]|nr:DUF3445 domain-containing protein [Rhodobacteraceae bacterium D3-12]